MRTAGKIGAGFAAFAPLLLGISFFPLAIYFMAITPAKGGISAAFPCYYFGFAGLIACSAIIVGVLFAVRAWRSERVADDVKPAWVILLTLSGIFAAPVFWWIHIWREQRAPVPLRPISRRGRIALGISSFGPVIDVALSIFFVAFIFLATLCAGLWQGHAADKSSRAVPAESKASPAEVPAREASPPGTGRSEASPTGQQPTSDVGRAAGIAVATALMAVIGTAIAVFIAWQVARIIHLVRVFRMDNLKKNDKVLWTLLLMFASFVAMPILWYLYVRAPAPPNTPAPENQRESKQE